MNVHRRLAGLPWRLSAVFAACVMALLAGMVHATPADGEYSLSVDVVEEAVDVGQEFTLQAVVEPGTNPPYQAAQWEFNIDTAFVELVSMEPTPGAPAGCDFSGEREASIILGCIDVAGSNITYSGPAFDVRLRCLQPGRLQFQLNEGRSFVNAGLDNQPTHFHFDTITCGGNLTVVVPSTSTPPAEPGTPPPGGTTPPAGDITPSGTTGAPGAVLTEEAVATRASGTPDGDGTPERGTPDPSTGMVIPPGDDGDGDGDDSSPIWPWFVVGGVAAAVALAGVAYWRIRAGATGTGHPG